MQVADQRSAIRGDPDLGERGLDFVLIDAADQAAFCDRLADPVPVLKFADRPHPRRADQLANGLGLRGQHVPGDVQVPGDEREAAGQGEQ